MHEESISEEEPSKPEDEKNTSSARQ